MKKVLLGILWAVVFSGCRMNNKVDSIVEAPTTVEGYAIEVPDAIAEVMEVENEPLYGEEGRVNCDNCGIELIVVENSYPLAIEQIEYRITNFRTEPISLREDFIEYFDDGDWKRVQMNDITRTDILHIVPAGQTRTFPLSIFPAKYNYPAGRYRVFIHLHNEDNGESYSQVGEFWLI